MKIYTIKCDCQCSKSLHSHVGCLVKGCDCQHGVPASQGQITAAGYPDNEVEVWPSHFRIGWRADNPELTVEEFLI